jgi:hypothetical protein
MIPLEPSVVLKKRNILHPENDRMFWIKLFHNQRKFCLTFKDIWKHVLRGRILCSALWKQKKMSVNKDSSENRHSHKNWGSCNGD